MHADLDSFLFYSILFRPSGEHVQAADMGRVMGTLMSDQIFAGVAYSGLVTNPLFSIRFFAINLCVLTLIYGEIPNPLFTAVCGS